MVPNWRDFEVGDSVMVGRYITPKNCTEWRNGTVTDINPGWLGIEVDVNGRKTWMSVQDEMLCPPGTHETVN
ncbi:hypothetical protein P3T76_005765 [Phytophthora citrophthora]|uniref:Uncharacterized protein n=1 Tax=Phytophthora citrophthora TaxID=4793 RepID=A0AAD9GRX7_9STRA|nr:hypothetical protein P3T76_005765 [Phytophthora citrophthora]